jgi:hypothetical protein
MSYTVTRRIPHPDGRCHIPDYWAATQILLPDVDRANRIPMPGQATLLVRAVERAPAHLALAPMPTPGARATISQTVTSKQTYVHLDSLNLNQYIPNAQS